MVGLSAPREGGHCVSRRDLDVALGKRGEAQDAGLDEQPSRGDLQRGLKSSTEGEYIKGGGGAYLVSHGE